MATGQQYTGPLNAQQLGEGHRACRENAQQLIEDSTILVKARRYRAGYMTALLASEELGKAIVLRLGLLTGQEGWETWPEWWKNYRDHRTKHAAAILLHAQQTERAREDEVISRINDAGCHVAKFRERIMYVDFDNTAFLAPPSETEMEKECRDELAFAEWLFRELSP